MLAEAVRTCTLVSVYFILLKRSYTALSGMQGAVCWAGMLRARRACGHVRRPCLGCPGAGRWLTRHVVPVLMTTYFI